MSEITYRMVTGKDLEPVIRLMAERGIPLPNIQLMMPIAWLAEREGEIIDMCILQAVPIIELHGASGETIGKLFRMAEKFIKEANPPRLLTHSGHRAMKKMLEHEGAVASEDRWYEWRNVPIGTFEPKCEFSTDMRIAKENGDTEALREMGE